MKEEFEITGHFYEIENDKNGNYRRFLDIKRKPANTEQPDLMVVMMNPGSSKPLDGINNNDKPSKAKPDPTQDQIMRVMNNVSFNYARVLNLSDLRTQHSEELYEFLKSKESKLVPHSIFDPSRTCELESLFVRGVPVVFGWGVD